jgi:hypothetical protein
VNVERDDIPFAEGVELPPPLTPEEWVLTSREAPKQTEPVDDPTVTFAEFIGRRDENTAAALVVAAEGTILPAGGLGILAAKVHDGKTTWAVEFVLHACAGVDYLGLSFPRPLRVLVIENEGPREAFRQKLEARLEHWEHDGAPRIWDDPAWWGQVRLSDPATRQRLRRVAVEHQIDLVVSDSLTRFGVRGNGTPEETREFVEWLTELGLGRDLAFLLLHHPRTRSEPGEAELERLAGAWPPHADLILLLQRLEGGRARLSFPKTRWARGQRAPIILAFDTGTESFNYVGEDVAEERDYVAELTELMTDGKWWTVTDLRHPTEKGGIGARLENVDAALTDERFESADGAGIGRRKGTTYHRLKEASPPPGDAGDASSLRRDGEEASPSPPREKAIGGDASSRPYAPVDDEELERLADLARSIQQESEATT